MTALRLGTRKSPLALAQAGWVADRLRSTGIDVELVGIVTEGDKLGETQVAMPKGSGKGIFVKAIDESLLKKKVDLAVHSAKDVPADLPDGLEIAAVPEREDAADLLVSRDGWSLASLPPASRVGTSSLRRAAQLRFLRPDVDVVPLRGNVETRLAKIGKGPDAAGCDAALLAAAGIHRLSAAAPVLEKMNLKSTRANPEEFLPAAGQGALLIVSRAEDAGRFSVLTDPETRTAVRLERALVRRLGADCSWPVGVHVRKNGAGSWSIHAAIFSIEGKMRVREILTGPAEDSTAEHLADQLMQKGGDKILAWNRRHFPS
ncbi:hydroxymethylbilane synthase [bacterium]|nr:hydroxymethylbilane synthase [bacterium]